VVLCHQWRERYGAWLEKNVENIFSLNITLPNDNQIKRESESILRHREHTSANGGQEDHYEEIGFEEGAKWMRFKIFEELKKL
jgi:hypothetical protein